MCENRKGRSLGEDLWEGSVSLSPFAAKELHKALKQMDLLLQARGVQPGLQALVTMLRHLQMLRRMIRGNWDRFAD